MTESRLAKAALYESQQALRGILDSVPQRARHEASAELYRMGDRDVMGSGEARLNYEEPMEFTDGRKGWFPLNVSSFTDDAGWACVEIHDTGPGISAEVLPWIFDPFFTTKRIGAGMGLGLSTSQSIVASFGGRLTVESPPGSGALFRACFPPAALGGVPITKPFTTETIRAMAAASVAPA